MKNLVLLTMMGMATSVALAQNPIIRDQYTADPTARVFNGKMYVYPSHDIVSPVEPEKKWFSMEDYHVFSSDNLTDWTDHGVIVTQNKVPWVKRDSYAMWAPDCVEKGGNYYFYFPAAPRGEKKGFGVGVAIAKSPEGPFQPMWRPIEGLNGIDPCVLIDPKDGKAYIYWAGMGMWMARLKDNMMELDSKPEQVKNLPEGFKEGPFVFERQGKYYYTFPWVRDSTETLAYAMGDSPMGPFEFKGVIMDESPVACWTNHHSIVEYKGQWYLFYHHNDYSPEFDKLRSARCDSLFFNADGTIRKVTPTLRGVGVTSARNRIEIDRYSRISGGADIEFINPSAPFEGWKTVFPKKGASVVYNRVDFGNDAVCEIVVRAKSASAARIAVKAGVKIVAIVDIPKTDKWRDVRVKVKESPIGIKDINVALMKGNNVEIDYIGFDMMPWAQGAMKSGKYRNLFAEMGYSQRAIDAKLQEAFDGLFTGKNKVYFEVGDSMAYISDIKNNDVRTEGMSYGMMIAVQWNKKDIFDRLWRWSKKYMQHQKGQRKGYFRWSCKTDGTPNAQGAASDGELYFVTSLIFASNRWGNDTGINYLAEAQNILNCSMEKTGMSDASPLINIEHKLITFTPDPWGGQFTDPSYHIPVFYEIWAKYANDGREQFWLDCAKASREYLHKSIHPVTGLNPDYNNFDGSLMHRGGVLGDAFRYDSWRVPMNIAMDYSWSCADRDWQQQYANRIQNFLYSKGIDTFLDQYNIDGSEPDDILEAGGYKKLRHSVGFVATSAAASLAATHVKSREFIERLWNSKHEPYEDGYFDAYYDGLVRLFALMHLSGRYRIIQMGRSKEIIDSNILYKINQTRTLLFAVCSLFATALHAEDNSAGNNVSLSVDGKDINVTFYSSDIVRVTKTPVGSNAAEVKSEVVTMKPKTDFAVDVAYGTSKVRMKSKTLMVDIDRRTGLLVFYSESGKLLLKEKNIGFEKRDEGSDKGRYQVTHTYQLEKNEAIYGLGTVQDGKLNRRGLSKIVEQTNLEDFQNVIQSIKGWGIYWDNYSRAYFEDNAHGMTFKAEVGDCADYYFMYGKTADGVNRCMRQLSGDVPMFPLWTFGYWQCRERYKSQQELLEVVDKYRKLQVPLDGIIQDWQYWGSNYTWNAMDFIGETFPNGKMMIDSVHKQNAHIMISIWASFGPQTQQYAKLKEKGLLFDFETWPQSGLSHIWPPRMDYPSGVRVYDAFSPVARQIYWDHLKKLFDYGMDAWWMDSTDPDFFNAKKEHYEQKGAMGSWRSVRNLFPLATVKGIYEKQRKASEEKRVFIMTRSAFAGQQHYGSGLWSGDVASTWDMLRKQVPAGLNYTMTGCPNFNTDIGGFFCGSYNTNGAGSAPRNKQYQELYVRWMQYGLFCPVFRSHGADAPREIYQFGKKGEPVYDAIEKTIRLRYRLLPYLYSTAWQVTSQGESYLRALHYDFASDRRTWDMADEFMFGRSILATPILNPQYTEEKIFREDAMSGWEKKELKDEKIKEVNADFTEEKTVTKYLPKGADWFDFNTETLYRGGRDVTIPSALDRTAMFVKAGSILPLAPVMQYATEKQWDNLDIVIYPGCNATFLLYEDEGDNYNYERGAYSTIEMKWDNKKRTLTIDSRKGNFPGMMTNRRFNIRLAGTEDVKTVNYNGTAINVSM